MGKPAPLGNKFAVGNNGGRPPQFENESELEAKINEYFDYCEQNSVKTTITGLALFLGFQSRQSLTDYYKRSPEFMYLMQRAKLAVENGYENSGQTIDIFALKQLGWTDKQEIDHTTNGKDMNTMKVEVVPPNEEDE